MKIILLLFVCLMQLLITQAQIKDIVNDDFSSNKYNWNEFSSPYGQLKIENGKYVWDCINLGGQSEFQKINIDSSGDFSISLKTSITGKGGNSINTVGLIFCSDLTDYYKFSITVDGRWALFLLKDKKTSVINGGASTAIKQGLNAVNTLRADKKNGNWELFVNDVSVYTTSARTYFGHYTGIDCGDATKAEFDDFKVSGIPLNITGKLCDVLPLIFKSGENKFVYLTGKEAAKDKINRYEISNSFNPTYYSLAHPENDSTACIEINSSSIQTFKSTLKKFKTNKEGQLYLKKIYTELKKCLAADDYYVLDMVDNYNHISISKKNSPHHVGGKIAIETIHNKAYNTIGYSIVLTITCS